MPWTRFGDMNSGGGRKEDFAILYIEAPEAEAKVIFYKRFGHNPERVSCTCCGQDYTVEESETLSEATAYDRGCHYDSKAGSYVERAAERSYGNKYIALEDFIASKERINGIFRGETVDFIFATDIKPEDRIGEIPRQGYVWCD